MALYKKEVLVRANSTLDFDGAMNWTRDWLMNTFQENPENKNDDGTYKDYFFADVFFAPGHSTNSGQTWRIYTDPCGERYGMSAAESGRIEFLIADLEGVKREIEQNSAAITMHDARLNDHEVRIEALEDSDSVVTAEVI